MYTVKAAQNQEDIARILQLRYEILRKPWGQLIETATDGIELQSVNAFIENESGEVIACGRLQKNKGNIGQIRFMAVNNNYQGKGLGKLIVNFLEEEAKKMNMKRIELQARENALQFYKNSGYTIKEKSYLMWGVIQHYLMEKEI